MVPQLCGWVYDQKEVEKVWATMPTPYFQAAPPEKIDRHNHLIFRELTGGWHDEGPQLIGDCVSWGWGRGVDYTQVLEMYLQLQSIKETQGTAAYLEAVERYEYQKAATEVIYALSRVEIGGGQIRGDGSVGSWAAKAVLDCGWISRQDLSSRGISGDYSGSRARQWGYSGLPNELEPIAKQHTVADVTPVRNVNDAAYHLENFRVIPVCSNVGFENGSRGITQRDSRGVARRRGQWNHCMALVSVRWWQNAPEFLLTNQWPPSMVQGPMGDVEIPPCSWWIVAEDAQVMLSQNDSHVLTGVKGYPVRRLKWRS